MLQLPCMLVCPFVCANRTPDRGCSKHPVFPAPSISKRAGSCPANLGRPAPRDRETILTSLRAQRSNPRLHLRRYGLLRCARNDVERARLRSFRTLKRPRRGPEARATTCEANEIAYETGRKPERTECRILRCSKSINMAPANGQWQSGSLLCIGATGIQASELSCRALQK